MNKRWHILSILLMIFAIEAYGFEDCIPRRELMDKHVVTYQAYNKTTRGCIVTPNFYTQQHKMGRGKLSRKFIIQICEGEPRTSPRIGRSFQICTNSSRPVSPGN